MAANAAFPPRKRDDAMRAAGLRLARIWVPDTRRPGFAEECRRQATLTASADQADPDITGLVDAALRDITDEA